MLRTVRHTVLLGLIFAAAWETSDRAIAKTLSEPEDLFLADQARILASAKQGGRPKTLEDMVASILPAWEANALKNARIDATRDEHGLELTIAGTNRRFAAGALCGPNADCPRYFYFGHLPARHLHILVSAYKESLRYVLVDDNTGQSAEFTELPSFSPDLMRFVVFNNDFPNLDPSSGDRVQVWQRSPSGPVLEASCDFGQKGRLSEIAFGSWPEPGKIKVALHDLPSANAAQQVSARNALVARNADGSWSCREN